MTTMKLQSILLFLLLIFSNYLSAQQPEQECSGAIQVLAITDTFPPYTGPGQFAELTYQQNTSCLIGGEENSVWIYFSACENDTLEFLINPFVPATDFDWALYDITNKTCEEAIDSANELRCNYSAIPGSTGLDSGYVLTSSPSGGPNRCAPLLCFTGQSLVLLVNNHAQDSTGFILSFTGDMIPCLFNGIEKDHEDGKIEISPNPSDGSFELRNLPTERNLKLKIFDSTGLLRFEEKISNSGNQKISLPPFLPEGFYFIKILTDEKDFGMSKITLIR